MKTIHHPGKRLFATTSLAAACVLAVSPARADHFYNAWTQQYDLTNTRSQAGRAVAIDSRGNIIATGWAQDSGSVEDVYTAKYDGLDGHLLWERMISRTLNAEGASVAVDSNDNVIVLAGDQDLILQKYTPLGTLAFANPIIYGNAGLDTPSKVVVDKENSIIICANSSGNNNGDVYTRKYTSGGTFVWEDRQNPFNREDGATDVVVDSNNDVIVAGFVTDTNSKQFLYVRKLNKDSATNQAVAQWTKTVTIGGGYGASSVAVDSDNSVYACGTYTAPGNPAEHSFYVTKFDTDGNQKWSYFGTPADSDFSGLAKSIAVGPDKCPVVTGTLEDASDRKYAATWKFKSTSATTTGELMWQRMESGTGVGNTYGEKVAVDGASNAIVIGETERAHSTSSVNPDIHRDILIAKYSAATGALLYSTTYNGSYKSSDDVGSDVKVDPLGNIAFTGVPAKDANGTARSEFVAGKLQRLSYLTGDALPDNLTGVPANATFSVSDAPAITDNGSILAKATFASGHARKSFLLQDGGAGGLAVPAVVGGTALGFDGTTSVGIYTLLFDPLVDGSGNYAFLGRLSGPKATANGLWYKSLTSLRMVLRQGTKPPATTLAATDTLTAVSSLSIRPGGLIALVKVHSSVATNTVLMTVTGFNTGQVLLRTGADITIAGTPSVIRSITVLSPSATSPGDGRWQGAGLITGDVVARLVVASKANAHLVTTAIVKVNFTGTVTELLSTATATPYKAFGLPCVASDDSNAAVLATLKPVTGTVTTLNDSRLLYSSNGGAFQVIAQEGGTPTDANLSTFTYTAFSDPVTAPSSKVAYFANWKGTGVNVHNNRGLFYGNAGSTDAIARTGTTAPAPAYIDTSVPQEKPTTYSAFINFALPANSGPIFVAKLAGSGTTVRNNLALFARDSRGNVRRLLRTGDKLDGRVVSSITLLKAVGTEPSAARSFNSNGTVALTVGFTNRTTAVLHIGVP